MLDLRLREHLASPTTTGRRTGAQWTGRRSIAFGCRQRRHRDGVVVGSGRSSRCWKKGGAWISKVQSAAVLGAAGVSDVAVTR